MNLSAAVAAEVPADVVAVMSTVPFPGGLTTVICVPDSAVINPAAPPKPTPVAPDRPVPVIVTLVPPAVLPLAGETPETAGRDERDDGETYVKVPTAVTTPAGVVTVMCTVPLPGGLMTVIRVAESAVIFAATLPELTLAASDRPVPAICVAESVRSFAATLPKLTLVAPDRPEPVIVTVVPPAVVPLAGEIPVIAGSDEPGGDEPGGEDDG